MSLARLLVFAILIPLAACSTTEDQKAEALATSYCTEYQQCRAEGFSQNWVSLEQCQSKETSRWLSKLDSISGETQLLCTLDEKAISTCTQSMEGGDCGSFGDKSWESDCATVLSCTQGLSADW